MLRPLIAPLFPYTTLFRSWWKRRPWPVRRPWPEPPPLPWRRPARAHRLVWHRPMPNQPMRTRRRSEEHTSELQSRFELVCRLLLEIKNEIAHLDIRRDERL